MPSLSRLDFGKRGEDLAVQILKKKNYQILEKNFRSKFGEIDIIAKDGDSTVFVEVKTRLNKKFGLPEEAVTPNKLKKILKTVDYYCLLHKCSRNKIRLEVVSILFMGKKIRTKLIKVDKI